MSDAAFTERVRYHRTPLAGVDAMVAATARSFPRHTHDQFGIGLVDSGGHGSWSGRGRVEAGPGSFISVNPGEVHDGHAVGHRARSWRILYFDPGTMASLLADVTGSAREFEFDQPVFADGALRASFERLFSSVIDSSAPVMACESAALILLSGLRSHAAARPRADTQATAGIRRARERLDADPGSPVTLAELAAECSLSRFQLLRAFAREVGLPPHAYLVQRRLALARKLLRSGVPIADAASRAGFSDQSHLTRCFSRQFATSPGRYALPA
jgi:AraC-like DNA-binding protein/quercetin dioxygenase-like cupin family protein